MTHNPSDEYWLWLMWRLAGLRLTVDSYDPGLNCHSTVPCGERYYCGAHFGPVELGVVVELLRQIESLEALLGGQ